MNKKTACAQVVFLFMGAGETLIEAGRLFPKKAFLNPRPGRVCNDRHQSSEKFNLRDTDFLGWLGCALVYGMNDDLDPAHIVGLRK